MDLLITKGMWDASVRLAYQLAVTTSIEEAFGGEKPAKDAPNTAPSEENLNDWAQICDRIFALHVIHFNQVKTYPYQKSLRDLEADIGEEITILDFIRSMISANWTVRT